MEPAQPRGRSKVATFGPPALATIVALLVWWLITVIFDVPSFLMPAPPDVVDAFFRLPGYLFTHSKVTLVESVTGFALATGGGLVLAALLVASRLVQRSVFPLLVAANAVPKLAIAPLLIIWMGFGQLPKVIMVVLICFFPIVVATVAGFGSTPSEFMELTESLSASRWRTFIKVRIPWAIPQIFVGLKVAISLAVVGAVVGEFAGGSEGLGYVITTSGQQADTPLAFAAITLLALMSVGLFYLLVALERLLLPWHRETTSAVS